MYVFQIISLDFLPEIRAENFRPGYINNIYAEIICFVKCIYFAREFLWQNFE